MRIGKSALIGAREIAPNKHIRAKHASRLAEQLYILISKYLTGVANKSRAH